MGKIRLRHGDSEIELEGDEGFIERQLADFYARFKIDAGSSTAERKLLLTHRKGEMGDKGVTPAEYLKAHAALNTNGAMQLVLLGRYLEQVRGQSDFAPSEINQIAKEAKLAKDVHPQRFADAVAAGLLRSEDGRYSITSTAEEVFDDPTKAKERFARKSTVKQSSRKSETKSRVRAKSVELEKFDAHKTDQAPSLEDFLVEKQPKSSSEWLAVVAYYITKLKGLDTFSEGNIDYAYRILQRGDRPAHLRQVLINYKNKYDLFDFSPDGDRWILTRTAVILVENKLPAQGK
jgi:hypothetical protein